MLDNNRQRIKQLARYTLFIACCFWWMPFSFLVNKGHATSTAQEAPLMDELLPHLGDSHALHFGSVTIGLPAIVYKKGAGWFCFSTARLQDKGHNSISYKGFVLEKGSIIAQDGNTVYDFSITKNVIGILLSVLIMLLLFVGLSMYVSKRNKQGPKGFWTVPLLFIRFVRNKIARKYIGEKHYERFTPYLLTLFFFILFNNLLGLLPEGANVTGNLSITLSLGFFTFLITAWNGSKHYWKHIFAPPNVPKFVYPIIIPIELIGMVIRPTILAIRLFANILAGHLVILTIIGVTFAMKTTLMAMTMALMVSIPLGVAMILLKIFVSFVQSYVFTLLSAIAFGSAVQEH